MSMMVTNFSASFTIGKTGENFSDNFSALKKNKRSGVDKP
jgi:hypothetical protein